MNVSEAAPTRTIRTLTGVKLGQQLAGLASELDSIDHRVADPDVSPGIARYERTVLDAQRQVGRMQKRLEGVNAPIEQALAAVDDYLGKVAGLVTTVKQRADATNEAEHLARFAEALMPAAAVVATTARVLAFPALTQARAALEQYNRFDEQAMFGVGVSSESSDAIRSRFRAGLPSPRSAEAAEAALAAIDSRRGQREVALLGYGRQRGDVEQGFYQDGVRPALDRAVEIARMTPETAPEGLDRREFGEHMAGAQLALEAAIDGTLLTGHVPGAIWSLDAS